jgi:hypothetical protein
VTDASAFTFAAICFVSAGLAAGITLRALLDWHAEPLMLALVVIGGMLQIVACTLRRDWPGVFESLTLDAVGAGLLAWDPRRPSVSKSGKAAP